MIEEILDERSEELGIAPAERATCNEIDSLAQNGILLVVVAWTIATRLDAADLGGREAEEKEVLRADLLPNLNVRPVERADGERAVKRKFHVAGAACLLACGGNLLRQIRGRIDEVRVRYIEVREEGNLKPVVYGGVGVRGLAGGVDQFDDALGEEVTRRSLASEDATARGTFALGSRRRRR